MPGESITENILRYLQERGIKQSWLASRICMNGPTLNRKLNGRAKLYADEYKAICDALKVGYDEFMDRRTA